MEEEFLLTKKTLAFMKAGGSKIREKFMGDSFKLMASFMKASLKIICLTVKEKSCRRILILFKEYILKVSNSLEIFRME
jgi:hypothetical protein